MEHARKINISYGLVALILMMCISKTPPAGSESLEDAWKTALSADYRLQAVKSQTQSAREQVAVAKAQRLPELNAKGGYLVLDNDPMAAVDLPIPGLNLNGLPVAEENSYAYQVTARLPLFTSGRIRHGIEAADAGFKAARADEFRTAQDLKLEVAEAYILVLRTRRALEVAADNVNSLSSHASNIQNFFDQGLVARNDLLAAQVALADARQTELKTQNFNALAQCAYNRLLGRPLDGSVVIDDVEVPPDDPENLEKCIENALANRKELEILDQKARALQNQAAMARAAAYPQMALEGGYSYWENEYLVHEGVWSAMIGVEWAIFDKGISRHRSGSLISQSSAQLNLRNDIASKIRLSVRQIWLDIHETQKRIFVTEKAMSQAEENLNVSTDRYRKGLGTNTEVLDAETLRTKSFLNYNNAMYDHILAMLRMRHAIGEL